MPRYSIIMIPVNDIRPNPDNPRKEAGDVSELARELKTSGEMLHPVLVVPDPDPLKQGKYLLEDGLRRWTAARQVWSAVPARVRYPIPGESLVQRELMTALATDIHKKQLTAMEKARAFQRLMDELHLTQSEVGASLGISGSTVSSFTMLLDLGPKLQKSVESGKIPVQKARELVKDARARQRRDKGFKPIDVGWEPDHFTDRHALSKKVRVMCDAKEHSHRRRYGGGCHACWETVIRQDEATNIRLAQDTNGRAFDFVAPLVPISDDGNIRVNSVKGAE